MATKTKIIWHNAASLRLVRNIGLQRKLCLQVHTVDVSLGAT